MHQRRRRTATFGEAATISCKSPSPNPCCCAPSKPSWKMSSSRCDPRWLALVDHPTNSAGERAHSQVARRSLQRTAHSRGERMSTDCCEERQVNDAVVNQSRKISCTSLMIPNLTLRLLLCFPWFAFSRACHSYSRSRRYSGESIRCWPPARAIRAGALFALCDKQAR